MVEFTLVAIPMMFVVISIFEMSRGMWNYHTLNQAVKVGARYASLHGAECKSTADGNASCPGATVGAVAQQIAATAIGLPPQIFSVRLVSTSGNVACAPLSSCLASSTVWPPITANKVGLDIEVSASYPFHSALAMFWPGSKPMVFSSGTFGAYSRQTIQF